MSKDRIIVSIAGLMFIVALIIFGSFLILQSPGCFSSSKNKRYWINPDSEEKLSQSLSNIKILRSKIEPWSQSNATLLKEMKISNDTRIIDKIIRRIPGLPEKLSENYKGLDFGPVFVGKLKPEVSDSIGISVVDISRIAKTADQRKMIEGWINQSKLKRDVEFSKMHDVVWFESRNNGPASYKLYVSGRITRTEKPLTIQKEMHEETKEQEVMPPFDLK
jgi:hypothetical protein